MISPQRHINARAAYIAQGERALATLGRWSAIAAIIIVTFLFADMILTLTTDLPPLLRAAEAARAG